MKTLILAALIAFSTTPAYGSLKNGNELLGECMATEYGADTIEEQMRVNSCINYVSGWVDGHLPLSFCIPEGVTLGQLIDVALKDLKENPQTRHEPAGSLLLKSFTAAFPCSGADQ